MRPRKTKSLTTTHISKLKEERHIDSERLHRYTFLVYDKMQVSCSTEDIHTLVTQRHEQRHFENLSTKNLNRYHEQIILQKNQSFSNNLFFYILKCKHEIKRATFINYN